MRDKEEKMMISQTRSKQGDKTGKSVIKLETYANATKREGKIHEILMIDFE